MSFKVINKTSKSIAIETLELLDHIDQFQYAGLDSYCSLGSIHNNIDVQIVDDIPGKKYETTISIGRLKELIGRLESLAEQEKNRTKEKEKMTKNGRIITRIYSTTIATSLINTQDSLTVI